MAQYAVHKIGFFYTDDCFVAEDENRTVMGITKSLEEAQAIKNSKDIESMKGIAGMNAVDFFLQNPNYDKIYKNLEAYFKSEFDTSPKEKYRLYLPERIDDDQAEKFLSIMELSFHNIVEYSDDEVINHDEFEFDEEDEISGF